MSGGAEGNADMIWRIERGNKVDNSASEESGVNQAEGKAVQLEGVTNVYISGGR